MPNITQNNNLTNNNNGAQHNQNQRPDNPNKVARQLASTLNTQITEQQNNFLPLQRPAKTRKITKQNQVEGNPNIHHFKMGSATQISDQPNIPNHDEKAWASHHDVSHNHEHLVAQHTDAFNRAQPGNHTQPVQQAASSSLNEQGLTVEQETRLKLDRAISAIKAGFAKNKLKSSIRLPTCITDQQISNLFDALRIGEIDIQKLVLDECLHLTQLPESLPSGVKELSLYGCVKIQSTPFHLPDRLEKLNLSMCTLLQSIAHDSLPSTLKVLDLSFCKNLHWSAMSIFTTNNYYSSNLEVLNLEAILVKDMDRLSEHLLHGAKLPLREFTAPYNITNQELDHFLKACSVNPYVNLKKLSLPMCPKISVFPSTTPSTLKEVDIQSSNFIENLPEYLDQGLMYINTRLIS